MYKAFQGANGWYVAWEENGWHYQPEWESTLSEEAARRDARRKNEDEEDDAE